MSLHRPFQPFRTLEDDMRDNPRPVDDTPHVHFHEHDGMARHAHEHIHWEGRSEHAHSSMLVDPPK